MRHRPVTSTSPPPPGPAPGRGRCAAPRWRRCRPRPARLPLSAPARWPGPRRARGRSRASARRPRRPAGGRPALSALRKMVATPAYGRVARHPRPVHVVVAQGDDGRAGLARPRRAAQVLLVQLGGGVDVARIGRGVLVDRHPRGHRRAQHRAAGLEPTRVQIGLGRRGPGRTSPCSGSGTGPRRRRPCCSRARSGPRNAASPRARSSSTAVPTSLCGT